MAGSNMFIMYANAKGDNVTISPRLGLGEFEPDFNSNAKVTLLAGSGIKDGMMTANVKCKSSLDISNYTFMATNISNLGSGGSCTSWRGGSMRLTDTSSNWIYSHKAGSSLKSNSQSAQLEQHDAHGNFKIDLTKAQSSSSTNPFVASSGSGSGNGSGNNSGGNSGNNGGSTTGGNTSTGGATAGSSVSIDREMLRMRQIAHGVMMSLAFL